jgi:tetratricopeptide (TPR) repeat protein
MATRAKTALIWVVIIAVFVAITAFGFTSMLKLVGLALLGAVVLFVAFIFIRIKRLPPKYLADHTKAEAAMARGDLDAARKIFERWWPTFPPQFPDALYGLAMVRTRQGDFEQALLMLNEEAGKVTSASAPLATRLAFNYALLGKLDDARKWLAHADERTKTDGHFDPGLVALARAIIDCRDNRCGDAAQALDSNWTKLESRLTGHDVRPLRIVRAFAHAATANAGDPVPADLTTVRPAYEREHDYLGASWPEMARFLVANGLAKAATP